jgi:hypothetical protein
MYGFTCFALPCTGVLGLEVKCCCEVSKITTENFDDAMGKICQSDVLNIQVGGVADVDVTYTDEVGKVLFVRFSPGFCFDFWRRRHWGGGGGTGLQLCVLLLCCAAVSQGTISR